MADVATPNLIAERPIAVVQHLIDQLLAGPVAAMIHSGKYNRWAASGDHAWVQHKDPTKEIELTDLLKKKMQAPWLHRSTRLTRRTES